MRNEAYIALVCTIVAPARQPYPEPPEEQRCDDFERETNEPKQTVSPTNSDHIVHLGANSGNKNSGMVLINAAAPVALAAHIV